MRGSRSRCRAVWTHHVIDVCLVVMETDDLLVGSSVHERNQELPGSARWDTTQRHHRTGTRQGRKSTHSQCQLDFIMFNIFLAVFTFHTNVYAGKSNIFKGIINEVIIWGYLLRFPLKYWRTEVLLAEPMIPPISGDIIPGVESRGRRPITNHSCIWW